MEPAPEQGRLNHFCVAKRRVLAGFLEDRLASTAPDRRPPPCGREGLTKARIAAPHAAGVSGITAAKSSSFLMIHSKRTILQRNNHSLGMLGWIASRTA